MIIHNDLIILFNFYDREYCKTSGSNSGGGPFILFNSLDMLDINASCYLDKYQGNLVISKKLVSPPFEPPQLVTPGKAKAFIEEHELLPLDKWHLDKPSVGSPSAIICTITSPSFDTASFLKKQQDHLKNLGSPLSLAAVEFEDEGITISKSILAEDYPKSPENTDARIQTGEFATPIAATECIGIGAFDDSEFSDVPPPTKRPKMKNPNK